MRVSDLCDFLQALVPALRASRASSAANDLERAVEGLKPFADMTLPELSSFLGQAEEYRRTGVLPAKPRRPTKRSDPAIARKALAELEKMYAEPARQSYSELRAHVDRLSKTLKKADLVEVAKAFDAGSSFKTKRDAADAIFKRLESRVASHDRTSW